MVLLGLVQTLQRWLFRSTQSDAMVTTSLCGGGVGSAGTGNQGTTTTLPSPTLSTIVHQRAISMDVSCSSEGIAVVAGSTGSAVDGTAGGTRPAGSFMVAARVVTRTPSSKRKLDELDSVETSSTSQVRPRRDAGSRDEQVLQEGSSAAETSGTQRQELVTTTQDAGVTPVVTTTDIVVANSATNGTTTGTTAAGMITTTGTPVVPPPEDAKGNGDTVLLDCLEDSLPCSGSDDEEDEEEEVEIDGLSECETNGEASCERDAGSTMVEDRTDGNNGNADMDVDRTPPNSHIQFFVRAYNGRSLVIQATTSDTVESVHQQVFVRSGLPVVEQRLIFEGRQLQHDQTLEECHVTNDATLNLVGRMRSTPLPTSWQLMNDVVSTIRRMIGADYTSAKQQLEDQDRVRNTVQEFLKMVNKAQPTSEHMQVLQLSGASSSLIMLLLSSLESNRNCAEETINCFLAGNEDYLPSQFHGYCAPVLLDFCKLLHESAPQHPIYAQCRTSLARLLDQMDAAHGSSCFNEAKAETIVEEFSTFVNDLAGNLMNHLKAYAGNSRPDFQTYIKDAKDFTAFLTHYCKAVAVTTPSRESSASAAGFGVGFGAASASSSAADMDAEAEPEPDSLDLTLCLRTFMAPAESFKERDVGSPLWLDYIFNNLLEQIDKCLTVVLKAHERAQEGETRNLLVGFDERPYSRAPFLFVLKGLHAVTKLSQRADHKFFSVLQRQKAALNVLVRQSRWQDDDFWLLEYKSLLDFESKKRLVMAMLPEPQDDHEERLELVVMRSQLLPDSLEQLAYVEPDGIQGGLSVEFQTEEATGPGVLREWFFMVCKEIFNPQFALFRACPNDMRRFFPNPASGVNPGHLTYFRFCGRVLALAMMHRVQLDVTFAVSFFKQLAGIPVTWEDAKDADPELYKCCKNILELDPEAVDADELGLTFVLDVEMLVGSRKTVELVPGGKDLQVSSSNRQHYVDLVVKQQLVGSISEQVKCFSQGFQDLLIGATTQDFLRPLDVEDLDLILYGKDRDISLEEWKLYTEYHDYESSEEQIVWFWQVVEGMTMERRRKLLFFATSITHLPPEGFAGLASKFHIHKAYTDVNWLPTAHTCFYQLILPPYPSFEIMHRSLYAITTEHVAEGFGFA